MTGAVMRARGAHERRLMGMAAKGVGVGGLDLVVAARRKLSQRRDDRYRELSYRKRCPNLVRAWNAACPAQTSAWLLSQQRQAELRMTLATGQPNSTTPQHHVLKPTFTTSGPADSPISPLLDPAKQLRNFLSLYELKIYTHIHPPTPTLLARTTLAGIRELPQQLRESSP